MKRPQGFDPAPPPTPQKPTAKVTPIAAPKPEKVKPEKTVPAHKLLRAAKRERKSYEKGEVRRFTRRSRSRRRLIIGGISLAVVFVTLIAVAVWSPLLALKEITIVGANRVDAAAVREALDSLVARVYCINY